MITNTMLPVHAMKTFLLLVYTVPQHARFQKYLMFSGMVTAANGNTRNNKISIIHHFYCFVTSMEVNPRKGNPATVCLDAHSMCTFSTAHYKGCQKMEMSQICPYSIYEGLHKSLHVNFYHM